MRSLLSLQTRSFGTACVIVVLSAASASVVSAAGLDRIESVPSLVALLTVSNDLERTLPQGPAAKLAGSHAASEGELFANSKAVMPFLVADLEPKMNSFYRPIVGRSVGVRTSTPGSRTAASR